MASRVLEFSTLIDAMIIIESRNIISTTSRNRWQMTWILHIAAMLFAFFDRTEIVLIATAAAIGEQFAKAFFTVVEVPALRYSTFARIRWQITVLRAEWFQFIFNWRMGCLRCST